MENAQAIDESLRKNQPNDLVVSRTDFEKLVDADDVRGNVALYFFIGFYM